MNQSREQTTSTLTSNAGPTETTDSNINDKNSPQLDEANSHLESMTLSDREKFVRSTNFEEHEFCKFVEKNDFKSTKKMLSTISEINFINEYGYSPLHIAAQFGNQEIVKLLVINGADIHLTNSIGVTALHLAAKYQQCGIVKFLILSGARLDHPLTQTGCRPIDFATFDSECWRILKNAERGVLPEKEFLREPLEMPLVPAFAMKGGGRAGKDKDKKSKKKGGKKSGGKKKKSGKKSGKSKSGKKKSGKKKK